jgi:hypothetical protein
VLVTDKLFVVVVFGHMITCSEPLLRLCKLCWIGGADPVPAVWEYHQTEEERRLESSDLSDCNWFLKRRHSRRKRSALQNGNTAETKRYMYYVLGVNIIVVVACFVVPPRHISSHQGLFAILCPFFHDRYA